MCREVGSWTRRPRHRVRPVRLMRPLLRPLSSTALFAMWIRAPQTSPLSELVRQLPVVGSFARCQRELPVEHFRRLLHVFCTCICIGDIFLPLAHSPCLSHRLLSTSSVRLEPLHRAEPSPAPLSKIDSKQPHPVLPSSIVRVRASCPCGSSRITHKSSSTPRVAHARPSGSARRTARVIIVLSTRTAVSPARVAAFHSGSTQSALALPGRRPRVCSSLDQRAPPCTTPSAIHLVLVPHPVTSPLRSTPRAASGDIDRPAGGAAPSTPAHTLSHFRRAMLEQTRSDARRGVVPRSGNLRRGGPLVAWEELASAVYVCPGGSLLLSLMHCARPRVRPSLPFAFHRLAPCLRARFAPCLFPAARVIVDNLC